MENQVQLNTAVQNSIINLHTVQNNIYTLFTDDLSQLRSFLIDPNDQVEELCVINL